MFEFVSWARVEMYGITWLYKYSNFINSCPRSNPAIHGFVKKKCRIHFLDSCFFPYGPYLSICSSFDSWSAFCGSEIWSTRSRWLWMESCLMMMMMMNNDYEWWWMSMIVNFVWNTCTFVFWLFGVKMSVPNVSITGFLLIFFLPNKNGFHFWQPAETVKYTRIMIPSCGWCVWWFAHEHLEW